MRFVEDSVQDSILGREPSPLHTRLLGLPVWTSNLSSAVSPNYHPAIAHFRAGEPIDFFLVQAGNVLNLH